MMARPPAAAVPRRKDDARLQNGPGMQKRPAAASESAASATRLLLELLAMLATRKAPAANSAGTAMCQMRSPLRSLERPQKIITPMLTTNSDETMKLVAKLVKPIAWMICGSHNPIP